MKGSSNPPEGQRFKPGQSGNPGGRPNTKWIREWLEAEPQPGFGLTRRQLYLNALFKTAIDREHKQHVAAAELLAAYDFGKPRQAVEVSGPQGRPLNVGALSLDELRSMRSMIEKVKQSE